MRAAVQELPAAVGTGLANWNWKVVHQFVLEHFGISLCRSSCLSCLHRLGFVLKRPRKRLVKADEVKREAFVARLQTGIPLAMAALRCTGLLVPELAGGYRNGHHQRFARRSVPSAAGKAVVMVLSCPSSSW